MAEDEKKVAGDARPVNPHFASIVPLHQATGDFMPRRTPRGPGKTRAVQPRPTSDDLVYHAEMLRQKNDFVSRDTLVKAAESRQEAVEVLQAVKAEVAREAAALLFFRMEEEKYGRDTSQISARRVQALKEVANLESEIKKMGVTMIDLRGERFQRIFKYFLDCIREASSEVLTSEQIDLFFNRLETKLEGWEDKAQEL